VYTVLSSCFCEPYCSVCLFVFLKCSFLTVECVFCWTAGAKQLTLQYVLLSTVIHCIAGSSVLLLFSVFT